MSLGDEDRLVLVGGATGNQGSVVARELLANGFGVRALTRDPAKPAARELAALGAEIVIGDYDDPASLRKAADGVYGVFSVQNFMAGVDVEIRHGKAFAEAAKDAGVAHFVYSSAASSNRATGISFHDSKHEIEEHIHGLGLPYTVFRPVFFMKNWHEVAGPALSGVLPWPLDPEKPLQQIAIADVAAFAVLAFGDPDRWLGQAVDLAGDELTLPQVADVIGRVTGRSVRYEQVSWEDFFAVIAGATGLDFDENFIRMFRWFNDVGYQADIPALRAAHPGMLDLEGFLRLDGWGEKT
ncbi:NmrA/HSCARG family protein [Solihabitans fulvus]|uniref:NmrA/HSCARG family protein n=1 Tax=Solihabitans fulvus TaxID=1892852 RepID=A0A5B2XIG4_9PSEU|nr:NmrA/HSCARG family protein [Solihabitans fulvus]KAA2262580.1 NmrA/HSCARG family protein [Solihabitans fulvus]